jgi:hypothetical protein
MERGGTFFVNNGLKSILGVVVGMRVVVMIGIVVMAMGNI